MAARILQVRTIQRTRNGNFAFLAAADGADVAADARAGTFGPPNLADRANHAHSIEGRTREKMSRTNLFFKVEIEHDPEEKPERIGDEICRRLLKLYGVRSAELSNVTRLEE